MFSNGLTRILLSKKRITGLALVPLSTSSFPIFHPLGSTVTEKHIRSLPSVAMVKRKNSALAQPSLNTPPLPLPSFENLAPPELKPAARPQRSSRKPLPTSTNPDQNPDILDGQEALRASPDADEKDERFNLRRTGVDTDQQVKNGGGSTPSLISEEDSSLSDLSDVESPSKTAPPKTQSQKPTTKLASKKTKDDIAAEPKESKKETQFLDPEADGEEEADEEEIQAALSRPPPVNSDYLPLPWKGRLGYVCAIKHKNCGLPAANCP